MKRALVVVAAVLVGLFGFAFRANAQSAVCSRSTATPGSHIGVNGDGATPGTTVDLLFNGSVIGAGTADGFGNFAVSGTIPGSTTPGLYPIDVTNAGFGTIGACTVSVEDQAAPASSSPSPSNNATSTATQAPVVTVVVQQQQQQQQQQQLPAPQPQHAPDPRIVQTVARSSLPTTGAATGELAQGGTGALIIGVSLIEFARRRKRRFKVATSTSSTLSEGDLFLPFWPR